MQDATSTEKDRKEKKKSGFAVQLRRQKTKLQPNKQREEKKNMTT